MDRSNKAKSNKAKGHLNRKCQRAERRKEREAAGMLYEVRPATCQKHVHPSKVVDAEVTLTDIPITSPGYISLCDVEDKKDRMAYQLEDLVGEGSHFKFKLQKWDGRWASPNLRQFTPLTLHRKSIPIADHASQIFCVCVGHTSDDGQPEGQTWSKAMGDGGSQGTMLF
jgi:hypothetical protein